MSKIRYRIIETSPGKFYVQEKYCWIFWKSVFTHTVYDCKFDVYYTSYKDAWEDLKTHLHKMKNPPKLIEYYFDEEGQLYI